MPNFTPFTLAELQEIGWRAYLDMPTARDMGRSKVDAAVKAVYENVHASTAVVPLTTSLTESLRRFDASRYKHVLLVAIEEPTLKPDVFSFGNGANPMEEIAALFTALRIRSEGEKR